VFQRGQAPGKPPAGPGDELEKGDLNQLCLLRRGKSPMPAKQFSKKWSDRGGRRSGTLSRSRAHALGDDPICVCVCCRRRGEHFRPPIARRILRCRKIAKKETRVEINCVCAADVFSINFGVLHAPFHPPLAAFEGFAPPYFMALTCASCPLAPLGSIKNRIMRMLANEQFSVLDCSLL
jgi:hypothetical protein